MKAAAIQMTSGPDVAANLSHAGALLGEARERGAALAVLPENFAFMGIKEGDKIPVAEAAGRGRIQDFLAATAQKLSLWIVAGTMPIRIDGERRVAPASIVFDSNGKQMARYDKIHLFDVDVPDRTESHRESASMFPGREPVVVDTPIGRVGLAVCYDMRFPELFRRLSAGGAQVFTIPSAFTVPTGRAHWETLLRARAIENLCYVIAPGQAGFHASGRETYGDSIIIDHWGRILSRLPRGTGVVTAEVDLSTQARVRESFPALAHRVL
jgi:deaminated glutathione amidase